MDGRQSQGGRGSHAIPDAITLLRPPIGAAAAAALFVDRGALAAWLYLAGYLTDVADGWSARALGVSSAHGRRLDGAADVAFHALVGLGLAVRALDDRRWWVLVVLFVLVAAEQVMRRWIATYTVAGKAIAGLYRLVMLAVLLGLTNDSGRLPVIVASVIVMAVTVPYEARNTLKELRSGERTVR